MKVESESEVAQSCPTLGDPMGCSLTVSSINGIFWATVLEWGAIDFSPGFSSHALISLLFSFNLEPQKEDKSGKLSCSWVRLTHKVMLQFVHKIQR